MYIECLPYTDRPPEPCAHCKKARLQLREALILPSANLYGLRTPLRTYFFVTCPGCWNGKPTPSVDGDTPDEAVRKWNAAQCSMREFERQWRIKE